MHPYPIDFHCGTIRIVFCIPILEKSSTNCSIQDDFMFLPKEVSFMI